MAEPTVAEMLTNVRMAINDAIVSGGAVEFEINGRRVKRDYAQLIALEKSLLERQASSQPAASLRTYASFGGRPS